MTPEALFRLMVGESCATLRVGSLVTALVARVEEGRVLLTLEGGLKGYIRAQTIAFEDFIAHGGEQGARAAAPRAFGVGADRDRAGGAIQGGDGQDGSCRRCRRAPAVGKHTTRARRGVPASGRAHRAMRSAAPGARTHRESGFERTSICPRTGRTPPERRPSPDGAGTVR
jgi:hypothetical protein